ncbi:MAG: hypothetical protein ACKVP3_11055 [Hyphomicrobiaceae bacterium]
MRWRDFAFSLGLLICFSSSALGQTGAPIEIVPQIGHANVITSNAFSSDGKLALTTSYDSTARLWDAATGVLLRTFSGFGASIYCGAFSPDGGQVLTGGQGRALRLWDATSGKLIRTLINPDPYGIVRAIAFGHDGRHAFSATISPNIRIWDISKGSHVGTLSGHTSGVSSLSLSKDGTRLLSSSDDKTLILWDVPARKIIHRLAGHTDQVVAAAISPDGALLISGSKDGTVRLWNGRTGAPLRSLKRPAGPPPPPDTPEAFWRWVTSVAISADGSEVAAGYFDTTLQVWDARSGAHLRTINAPDRAMTVSYAPNMKILLTGGSRQVRMIDTATGATTTTLQGAAHLSARAVFTPDGANLISSVSDGHIKVWDASSGRLTRVFGNDAGGAMAISLDGTHLATGGPRDTARLWDVRTGHLLRTLVGHGTGQGFSGFGTVAFSADGDRLITGGYDKSAKIWDLGTGQVIRSFDGHAEGEVFYQATPAAASSDGKRLLVGAHRRLRLFDAATGKMLRDWNAHAGGISAVAFDNDGTRVLSAGLDKSVKLWSVATGALLQTFSGHENTVASIMFSRQGSQVLSAGYDGAVRIVDAATGRLHHVMQVGSMLDQAVFSPDDLRIATASRDGTIGIWNARSGSRIATLSTGSSEWLAITPHGFFAGSQRDLPMLALVRGTTGTSLAQVHQSLFNPDLVREALSGDPTGEVTTAASQLDLTKVLDSGPPPTVVITSHAPGSVAKGELEKVTARVSDRGTGIGRIEWRVNGITVGVTGTNGSPGPNHEVGLEVALETGENVVEVVAYNSANLLASPAARATVSFAANANAAKPKLHVLAIGINAYDPAVAQPLNLAVADARAVGDAFKRAATNVYAAVQVHTVTDKQATLMGIEAAIRRLAQEVHPRDTVVIFAAAHGTSENGRFYLVPQDYPGGEGALGRTAIGQDRIQHWLANIIKARKVVLFLDTCESGALIAGHTRGRDGNNASEASVGRLHEATGRPVLTAAAAGQYAHEGIIGTTGARHGVFTWALLDGLRNGDADGDGVLKLAELAAHVQKVVPALAARFGGAARTAVAAPEPIEGIQAARFGTRGEDFAIAGKLTD